MEIISKRIKKQDIQAGLNIYNYYIINSYANFEEKKLSLNEFLKLFKKIKLHNLPFIIAKYKNEVIGVAFVNQFREKSGYRFTYEHSIYVSPKFTNQGYGSIILKNLIKICKKNIKIKNLIAVIGGSDNKASIIMHEKNGFRYMGTLKKIGYKKTKWIDSVYMQKKI